MTNDYAPDDGRNLKAEISKHGLNGCDTEKIEGVPIAVPTLF